MSKKNQGKGKKSVQCMNINCENFSKKATEYCLDHCHDLAKTGVFNTTIPCRDLGKDGFCSRSNNDCVNVDSVDNFCQLPSGTYTSIKVKKAKKRSIEQTVELLENIYLKVADYSEGGCGVCSIKREDMLMIVGRKKLKESRVSEIQSVLEEAKGLLLIDEDHTFYIMDLDALPAPYPVTADIIMDAMTQI